MSVTTFPSSPSLGQFYAQDGVVYTWDGLRWTAGWGVSNLNSVSKDIVSSTIAPATSVEGTLWLNPTTNEVRRLTSGSWQIIGNITGV
jgi:hypothetical protein